MELAKEVLPLNAEELYKLLPISPESNWSMVKYFTIQFEFRPKLKLPAKVWRTLPAIQQTVLKNNRKTMDYRAMTNCAVHVHHLKHFLLRLIYHCHLKAIL